MTDRGPMFVEECIVAVCALFSSANVEIGKTPVVNYCIGIYRGAERRRQSAIILIEDRH
jgi:hypothetical protein